MSKRILLLATLLVIGLGSFVSTASASTLGSYYARNGQKLPSVKERALQAAQYGIFKYKGTTKQNLTLLDALENNIGGFSVATGYQKSLRVPMSATQNYVPVSSLQLKDGTTLSMAVLGDKVFLDIDPGGAKEELVVCTGIDGSAVNFTGCTRGLAFSGTSTASVAAIAYPHNASTPVVMSNVHYVYEQYVDINGKTQTITGNKTYTGINTFYFFPVVSSTGYTGIPTQNGELTSKYYVDTQLAGGFSCASVSTTLGLMCSGAPAKFGINASSTTGLTFDANGALYQKVSATSGLQYAFGSNGIEINTTTLVNLIATNTPTANLIPIATASGTLSNNWINTSTIDGSSFNIQSYTAGETLDSSSTPISVYLKSTDGRVYKTSSAASTTTFPFVGFTIKGQNISAGNLIKVQTGGLVSGFISMNTSSAYFISTFGSVSSTAGTVGYKIGNAVSPTTLFIQKGKKVFNGTTAFGSTSTTTITVGFRASSVTVYSAVASGAFFYGSQGGYSLNGENCIYTYNNGSGSGVTAQIGASWLAMTNSGTNTYHQGSVTNITDTSFVLSNSKNGTPPNVDLFYQAEE